MYQAPLEAWDAGERSQGAPQARHLLPCGGATLPTAYPGCAHAAGGRGPGRVPWRVGVGFAETLSLHSLGFRQRKGGGGRQGATTWKPLWSGRKRSRRPGTQPACARPWHAARPRGRAGPPSLSTGGVPGAARGLPGGSHCRTHDRVSLGSSA